MDALDIARWQFGITTVYHFMMVPLTIGLGLLLLVLQTFWLRTKKPVYLRMTKFWGKLYLINFVLGVATGLVQEFQFGMAWSEYSRFVGDIFGAPLAMEALLAFFVESTFLGLWIFGWKKLKPALHTACLWIAVLGSVLSAYFIIAANSWMQHPVGATIVNGRPVLNDWWAMLTNNTALTAFPHAIAGSLSVAGAFLLGIAWYQLYTRRKLGIDVLDGKKLIINDSDLPGRDKTDHKVWIRSLRVGAVIAMVGFAGTAITGDLQGKLMFEQQPMKMATAEAACHDGTSFSVLSLGDLAAKDCSKVTPILEIPGLLSFLAHNDFTTTIKGVATLIPEYQQKYGATIPNLPQYGDMAGKPVNYVPVMPVTYWGFRLMIGLGGLSAFAALVALFITRRGTVPKSKNLMRLAVFGILAPFGANAAGWIFTELGRQPFVVAPNPTTYGIDPIYMFTAAAVSPGVTAGELLFSLCSFALIYAVLLVVEVWLIVRYVRAGVVSAMPELDSTAQEDEQDSSDDPDGSSKGSKDDVLAFAY